VGAADAARETTGAGGWAPTIGVAVRQSPVPLQPCEATAASPTSSAADQPAAPLFMRSI